MDKIVKETPKKIHTRSQRYRRLAINIVGIAIVLGVALAAYQLLDAGRQQHIDVSTYQAVYLTNGQMYFGKLQNTSGEYLTLKSAYMPQATSNQAQDTSASALIRVRDQLWGPTDSMAIRSSQVAFWQNLRDDSKVAQAIKVKSE